MNSYTGLPMCTRCSYLGCTGQIIGHIKFHTRLFKERHIESFKKFIRSFTNLDYSKIEDIKLDGIDIFDYPDFCDAFIVSATYKGREMTEKELDRLNEDGHFVYQCIQQHIY